MAKCRACKFSDKCATNNMKGIGKKGAPIMVVLDAPDWMDDREGKPLSSDGGLKIKYYLKQAGISLNSCYFTYAVKCKPDCKPAEIKAKELETCRAHLLKEIKTVKPKVIMLMGKIANQSLTGNKSVADFRGHFDKFTMKYKVTVGDTEEIKEHVAQLVPTYSPYAALSKWEYDDYVIHDFKKAKKYIQTKKLPETPKPTHEVIDSIEKLRAWKKEMLKYKGKPVIHDFETTSLDFTKGEIINSGYSVKKDHAYILYLLRDWPEAHRKKFTPEQNDRVEQLMKFTNDHYEEIKRTVKLVHTCGIIYVGHNHKFDRKYAKKAGIPMKFCRWDTVVMDAVVDENKRHALNIAMEYQGINYGPYDTYLWPFVNKDAKNKKPYTHVPPDMLDEYLAIDVAGCRRLFFILHKKLKDMGMLKFYLRQQKPLLDELMLMEYHGFRMNTDLMKSDAEKIGKRIDELIAELKKITNDPEFNPNSPAQLSEHMELLNYPFDRLEIKRGKSGYSTGADELKKFVKYKKWKQIPELVLELRALRKIKGTYIINDDGKKGMLPKVDSNGYLHCSFNVHTPRTGRLSSSDPNFQNIPNPSNGVNVRNYFIPPKHEEKWCTWEADYSALEMKVVAHLSQDKVMIKQLQDGVDMHSFNAVRFGHVLGFVEKDVDYDRFKTIAKYDPEDKAKYLQKFTEKEFKIIVDLHPKFSKLRAFAKSVGFGLNYGIEARTLSEDNDVPVEDVEVAIDTYFDGYRGLARQMAKWRKDAIEKGYLTLPWTGRTRKFQSFSRWINSPFGEQIRRRDFFISEVERQAMNFPVQGFANEIYTRGKLKVIKRLRKEGLKSKILISIHDGVVGIGPVSEMHRVKQICHEEMTTLLGKGDKQLELNIDFNCNEYWYGPQITDYENAA